MHVTNEFVYECLCKQTATHSSCVLAGGQTQMTTQVCAQTVQTTPWRGWRGGGGGEVVRGWEDVCGACLCVWFVSVCVKEEICLLYCLTLSVCDIGLCHICVFV